MSRFATPASIEWFVFGIVVGLVVLFTTAALGLFGGPHDSE